MSNRLTGIITAPDPSARNQSLDAICRGLSLDALLAECAALDDFRRTSSNLYERVRALFFLYAIHRFHIPRISELNRRGLIPFQGYEHLLQRRFEEAIDDFLAIQQKTGPSDAISSALAAAYHRLAFQTLADQVRRSVRSVRGNQWMFRMGHPGDQPLRIRPELLQAFSDGTYPILRERTPVRMDLTHSGWSDIFFLGMDFPEGARVLNVSIRSDQVRRSVRSVRGNQWMFRMGHPGDQPLRIRPELLQAFSDGTYPILRERTPVRMDLTHSGWSDIFFLGMDFPEGARVLNVSI